MVRHTPGVTNPTHGASPAAPTNLRITHRPVCGLGGITQYEFMAYRDSIPVGVLFVNGDKSDWRGGREVPPRTIMNVLVRQAYRRRGVATALLTYAREVLPKVLHSPYRSADGEGWARRDPQFVEPSRPGDIRV